MPLPTWALFALILGAIQIVVGSATVWAGTGTAGGAIPDSIFVLIALVNAGVAILLLLGGRRDPRALPLGAVFVFSGSAFSLGPLLHLSQAFPSYRSVLQALAAVPVETLLPYFFWRFASEFPQVTRYGHDLKYITFMTRLSLATGTALIMAALARAMFAGRGERPSIPLLDLLERAGPVYWPALLLLVVTALVASLAKLWHAKVEERRRVTWLVVGLAVGLAPVLVVNGLAWLIPAFGSWAQQPGSIRKIGLVVYPAVLVSPLIIAYSVLVEHALDVRLVVRKAIQYALVRYSLATLVAIPFGVLTVFLYINRSRTLSEVFSGGAAIALLSAALLSLAALAGRRAMARAIDRRFFREEYDARQVLAGLVNASQRARDGAALGDMMVREIHRALHPRAACLMLRDPTAETFVAAAGYARPLRASATLIQRLADSGKPFAVEWERSKDPVYTLPADETEWLGDGGFRLLVPILSTTGGVAGLLGLADKLSELPYSREDQALLEAIATSAGLTIENQALRSGIGLASSSSTEFAAECRACGKVSAPTLTRCLDCGGDMLRSPVPLVLAGKYEFVQRVGRGGMGVVYRARDLALEREVAIKTLPRVSPQHAQRLRREARAMASLSHPNLSLIHAVESWHGTPLLVLEYLPGGTLADRLRIGRLSLSEAIELGLALTTVADYIHHRGILHRDIKPSNIGFTATAQPKLLDFGVARLLEAARPGKPGHSTPPWPTPAGASAPRIEDPSTTITVAGEVVGTLLYLPPEALDRVPPGPAFDLWSICMVLYEATAGANPLADEEPTVALRRLSECDIPDIRRYAPELSAETADFFSDALAQDPRRRPSSAAELRSRLSALLPA